MNSMANAGKRTFRLTCQTWMKRNLLLLMTLTSVILGVAVGFLVRLSSYSPDVVTYVYFPGDLLMRMLKCLVLPLIITSMISGVATADSKCSGRMAGWTFVYFVVTTFLAIVNGLILVISIRPGKGLNADVDPLSSPLKPPTTADAFFDLFRNLFPDNILQAGFQHTRTVYVKSAIDDSEVISTQLNISETVSSLRYGMDNSSLQNHTAGSARMWTRSSTHKNGVNALGILLFCVVFGIVLSRMGKKASVIVQFFCVLNDAVMNLVMIVMWYSPVGIFFLIVGNIMAVKNPERIIRQLGLLTVTTVTGLLTHALIVLPGIYFVFTRKNPFHLISNILQALVTAVGVNSSAATLPVTFRCLEENMKIDKRVTRLVLPIGTTINMDGTALYIALAPVFIAQMHNIDLNFGQLMTLSITATFASIGTASVPSGGLVTMVMVLTSVGLPVQDISLLLTIDWFLDRIRTTVNVLGDSVCTCVIAHLFRNSLHEDKSASVEEQPIADPVLEEVV